MDVHPYSKEVAVQIEEETNSWSSGSHPVVSLPFAPPALRSTHTSSSGQELFIGDLSICPSRNRLDEIDARALSPYVRAAAHSRDVDTLAQALESAGSALTNPRPTP